MTQEAKSARDRTSLLDSFSLAGLPLRNRLAVAPMSRVSATGEGVPTERMASYYASFAEGGFALVITEGVYTDEGFSRSYARQPGLATEAQVAGWRGVVDAVHAAGGFAFAQLMHGGALSQVLEETIAPSAVRPKGEKKCFCSWGLRTCCPLPELDAPSPTTSVLKSPTRDLSRMLSISR